MTQLDTIVRRFVLDEHHKRNRRFALLLGMALLTLIVPALVYIAQHYTILPLEWQAFFIDKELWNRPFALSIGMMFFVVLVFSNARGIGARLYLASIIFTLAWMGSWILSNALVEVVPVEEMLFNISAAILYGGAIIVTFIDRKHAYPQG